MAMPQPTTKYPMSAEADLLLTVLRRIQKIDPEFPLQYTMCFIEIALNEGCSVTNLADKTNLALSTVSRIVGALSDYRQMGKPFKFIEVKVSEIERRKKELYLTDYGREVLKEILTPLEKK